jgi:hypothetical protein
MNQQESMRAAIVYRLCAGQSIKDHMNFANIRERRCGRRRSGLPARLTEAHSEIKVYAAPRNKTDDLTKKMKEAMGSLDRDTVAKACMRFCSTIETVVADDGVFIEYVNS